MRENSRKRPSKPAKKPIPSAAPEVVYTQPEPLNRKKLILRLVTVFAVVLALFIGFSIFFRVDTIEISGNDQYNASSVLAASGIEYGDGLLTFGKAKACARIIEALPYVDNVRIGIKLPGTVRIYIQEVDVVYAIQDENDGWWLMTAEGRIVEGATQSNAVKHTLIKGVKLTGAKAGAMAQAMEPEPQETYVTDDEEQTVITVTNGERLQTVIEILKELERNEILGEVSIVDATDMGDLQLWYSTKTQVLLGDPSQMDVKIATLKAIMSDDAIDSSGIIDLSKQEEDEPISLTPFE